MSDASWHALLAGLLRSTACGWHAPAPAHAWTAWLAGSPGSNCPVPCRAKPAFTSWTCCRGSCSPGSGGAAKGHVLQPVAQRLPALLLLAATLVRASTCV
jgi:hypothetical protein